MVGGAATCPRPFLGNGPDRGQSPIDWGEMPSVHTPPPETPLLAGPQAHLAGHQAGHQALLAGPRAALAGPQALLAGP